MRIRFGYAMTAGVVAGCFQALVLKGLPAFAQMTDTGFAGHSSSINPSQMGASSSAPASTGRTGTGSVTTEEDLRNSRSSPLQLTPFLDFQVIASDNIDLRPEGQEKSGVGGQLGAGVIADYQNNRTNAFGTASVLASLRSEGDDGTFAPAMNANASTELVRDRLFMDASMDYGLAFTNQGGGLSFSGLGSDDNKGYGQVTLSPYLRQDLGRKLVSELRYTHQQIFSPDELLDHQMTNAAQAVLATSNPRSRFGAELMGMYSATESDNNNGDLQLATGMATARYALSPSTSVLVRGGYDYVESPSLEDRSGAFYGVGVMMRPNSRLHTYALVGRRYNELDLEMDTAYAVTRQISVGASAMHQAVSGMQTSFQDIRLSGNMFQSLAERSIEGSNTNTDIIRDNYEVNPSLVTQFGGGDLYRQGNTFQNRSYISNMINAYVTGNHRDVSGYLLAGVENRDYDDFQDDQIMNVMGGMNYQLAPKWVASADGMYQYFSNKNVQTAGRIIGARLGLSYALTQKTALTLALSRTEQDARNADFRYTEHALIAGLRAQF